MDKKKKKVINMSIIDLIWMRKGKNLTKRYIELDLLRGLAILLMIFGHFLWDLDYFGLVPMNSAIYSFLQKTVPPMFFIIVGMSLIASYKKKQRTPEEEKKYYENLVVRGLKIFNFGMFLTIASILAMPGRPVFFGVLHCIGLSIVLSALFLKYRVYNFAFSIAFIAIGLVFAGAHASNPTILHFVIGIHPADIWRYTVDYFPIFPWFGLTLLGIAIGDILYCENKRRFRFPDLSKYRPAKIFSWIGRHSLEIYLLHQPVIAGALYVFVRYIKI